MTRHDLTVHLKRQKAKTTAELHDHLHERDPQRFKPGLYFNTRGGDIVRVNDTTWMSVYGTLWREIGGKWSCFGSRAWAISGRSYDACPAIPSLDDLTRIIAKPTWLEGIAA